jgi:hypothetical protein
VPFKFNLRHCRGGIFVTEVEALDERKVSDRSYAFWGTSEAGYGASAGGGGGAGRAGDPSVITSDSHELLDDFLPPLDGSVLRTVAVITSESHELLDDFLPPSDRRDFVAGAEEEEEGERGGRGGGGGGLSGVGGVAARGVGVGATAEESANSLSRRAYAAASNDASTNIEGTHPRLSLVDDDDDEEEDESGASDESASSSSSGDGDGDCGGDDGYGGDDDDEEDGEEREEDAMAKATVEAAREMGWNYLESAMDAGSEGLKEVDALLKVGGGTLDPTVLNAIKARR